MNHFGVYKGIEHFKRVISINSLYYHCFAYRGLSNDVYTHAINKYYIKLASTKFVPFSLYIYLQTKPNLKTHSVRDLFEHHMLWETKKIQDPFFLSQLSLTLFFVHLLSYLR